MHAYQAIEKGFMISLNLSLYARESVIKALYRYHDRYIISYDLADNQLLVYFEDEKGISNAEEAVSEVMKELDFQMIRYDTMKSTKHVRELLIARALYASCIEEERTVELNTEVGSSISWREDQRNIFSSWSTEQ